MTEAAATLTAIVPFVSGVPAPTIGRIVHFYTANKPPRAPASQKGQGPFAAIVTDVNAETRSITITVLPPCGESYWVHGVRHKDDASRGFRFWDWPPR